MQRQEIPQMIKSLKLENFTAFGQADLQFSPGLNVIVGENGTGKSHLLKLAYTALAVGAREDAIAEPGFYEEPIKSAFQRDLADKLMGVFRPEAIGRLVRRKQGRQRCEVSLAYDDPALDITFTFATNSRTEVSVDEMPSRWADCTPVFLPTRELLTIYPGFLPLYEGRYVEFPETWRDTCSLLGRPAVKGDQEARVIDLIRPLETAMDGTVELDRNGRFYLATKAQGRLEIPLVAEGLRKLAMLARLIVTGALLGQGCLFWDEPEANLNPKLIRAVAGAIVHLANAGQQVFIATHSLFLMRELDIRLQDRQFDELGRRFVSLEASAAGVKVHQGDSVDEIDPIVSLDEELRQSDRYLEVG